MSSDSQQFQSLRESVFKCESFADFDVLLNSATELSPIARIKLQLIGAKHLLSIVEAENESEQQLVISMLINACLARVEKDAWTVQGSARELLRTWLEELPEEKRHAKRDEIIDRLLDELAGARKLGAFRTIGKIGYCREDIEKLLVQSLEDKDVRVAALSALAGIGACQKNSAHVVETVSELDDPDDLLYSLFPLEQTAGIDALKLCKGIAEKARETGNLVLQHTATATVLRLSNLFPDDDDVQAATWQFLSERSDLFRYGVSIEFFDSDLIISKLWEIAFSNGSSETDVGKNFFSIAGKALNLVSPTQVMGWDRLRDVEDDIALRGLAILKSGVETTLSQTFEAHIKEVAWNWLTNLSKAIDPELLSTSLSNERNAYTQAATIRQVSWLPFPNLPAQVHELIVARHDSNEDDNTFVLRMAAINVARNSATLECFDTLLNFGLTHNGEVLRDNADALAQVLEWLVDSSAVSEAIESTLLKARQRNYPHQQEAAISALAHLCYQRKLPSNLEREYANLLFENGLKDFSKTQLVRGLAGISDKGLARDSILKAVFIEQGELGSELLYATVEFLAQENSSETLDSQTLESYLKADRFADRWWKLNCYANGRKELESEVGVIIEEADSDDCYKYLKFLASRQIASSRIASATIVRMKSSQLWQYTEGFLFDAMSCISETVFVSDWWEDLWTDWRVETRIAFVSAHSRIQKMSDENASALLDRFVRLSIDSLESVRLAAFAEFSRLDLDGFKKLIVTWIDQGSEDLKVRAAEAMQFIPHGMLSEDSFRTLVLAPIRIIREVAKSSKEVALQMLWASQHADRVCALILEGKNPALEVPYIVNALGKIGSLTECHRFKNVLSQPNCHPSSRAFLLEICKRIEERLSTDRLGTEKELMLHWDAICEKVEGELECSTKSILATLTLWRRPAAPGRLGDWFGTGRIQGQELHWTQEFTTPIIGEVTLKIVGREKAEMIITYRRGNSFICHGSGPYPSVAAPSAE